MAVIGTGGVSLAEKKYALDRATVVLYNPLSPMRATIRDAMLMLGFRQILDYGDLERARSAVLERGPDLVLLDLDRDKESVCKLVREVRHSRLCVDPFVVMIALSWHPSIEAVNNSLEAGVDDIITMPLSIKLISERLDALIHGRKQFVVTSSYVGPERRSPERAAADPLGLGTIRVPNNLRFRAIGDEEAAASPDAITAVQARIDHHRLNRHAQRLVWLTEKSMENGGGIEEIAGLVNALAFELESQGHEDLLHITGSMARVLQGLRRAPSKQLYDLMRVHGLAVTATLMEREGAAEMVIAALNEATARLNRAQSA